MTADVGTSPVVEETIDECPCAKALQEKKAAEKAAKKEAKK